MRRALVIFGFMMQKLLRGWGRIAILVALGGLGILISALMRANIGPGTEDGAAFLVWYGLSIILPLGSLLVSSEALGDLREERTLVYLWLRPVRSWEATGGAAAAAFVVVFVFLVVPLTVAGLILDWPMVGPAALAALAYVCIFLAFGLILSRPLLMGLLGILVWENVVGSLSAGTARLTIRSYVASLLVDGGTDVGTPVGRSFAASIAVPLAVAAAGLALTAWRWRRAEVA